MIEKINVYNLLTFYPKYKAKIKIFYGGMAAIGCVFNPLFKLKFHFHLYCQKTMCSKTLNEEREHI